MASKSKKTAKASAARAARFDESAKITMLDKTNPRREGGEQHRRYGLLVKLHGKPVSAIAGYGPKDGPGVALALRRAVKEGRAKVA